MPRLLDPRLAGFAALLALAPATHAGNALVYSTDFTTAYYSSLPTAPPHTPTLQIDLTCADGVARASGGHVALLGRFGCDYLQFVDPQSGFATTAQWSTGNGTNPQDFVLCTPSKAYVSLYERDHLLILNPQTGQHLGEIDLSAWSDDDGLPEASGMVRVGDRAFVALQRLDRDAGYSASHTSYLAVVDCLTDALVDADTVAAGIQAIALQARNPLDDLFFDPVRQKIAVACAGNFGVLDGGVEWVDPVSLQSEGVFVSESTLGGDINANRLYVDCTGYAIINDTSFNTSLVQYDHCSGTLLGTCRATSGFTLSDLEIAADGVLYLVERDLATPGVRRYQLPACNELTTSPIAFGLPPLDLLLVGDDVPTPTNAAPAPRTALRLSANQPDPFNPGTTFFVEAPAGMAVQVVVMDARGRVVRRLWEGRTQAKPQPLTWDGTDRSGRAVASGVYFAVVRGDGLHASERMTLVR